MTQETQERYIVKLIGQTKVPVIVKIISVSEDGNKCEVKVHPRPDYTVDECKAVAYWLNHRETVYNAADRLATACSNYYERTGMFAAQIRMHPRFRNEVVQTIPLQAVQDLLRWDAPTFYGVPVVIDSKVTSDYELIASR